MFHVTDSWNEDGNFKDAIYTKRFATREEAITEFVEYLYYLGVSERYTEAVFVEAGHEGGGAAIGLRSKGFPKHNLLWLDYLANYHVLPFKTKGDLVKYLRHNDVLTLPEADGIRTFMICQSPQREDSWVILLLFCLLFGWLWFLF